MRAYRWFLFNGSHLCIAHKLRHFCYYSKSIIIKIELSFNSQFAGFAGVGIVYHALLLPFL